MRYIYLLLITFIFASCGNQKMRFVRNNSTKQKIVAINDLPTLKTESETAFIPKTNEEISEEENSYTSVTVTESDESIEEETAIFQEDASNSFPRSVQDSTVISTEKADAIAYEAARAEKNGTRSLVLSILIFVFLFLMIVASFIALAQLDAVGFIFVAVAFLLFAFVSWILSMIFGIVSLRASYNTVKGRKRAIIGLAICGIPLLYFLVGLLFAFA
ncbi:MAG: hypothetical protein HRT58_11905 [Crocinitomicaceae bacterium]|nr:hypothetical protein [Flavobacteriales bacterium]NQZ36364.1 hypothetical protein [Crocinitomicaceae bacterium]